MNMKNTIAAIALAAVTSTQVQATSMGDTYMESLLCGFDAMYLKSTADLNDIVTYCVGQSHEPRGLELQAYIDASKSQTTSMSYMPKVCKVDYAFWYGDGTRSSWHVEGAIPLYSEKEVLLRLELGWHVYMVQDSRLLGDDFTNRVVEETELREYKVTEWGKGCFDNLREMPEGSYYNET